MQMIQKSIREQLMSLQVCERLPLSLTLSLYVHHISKVAIYLAPRLLFYALFQLRE